MMKNGYILQVKEDYSDIVEKICPIDLSPAVLRTLLVIALKEPIRQTELVKLRSAAYEHVADLVEKGLVSKHKDKNGRSINIKTTAKFAEYFKLKGDTKSSCPAVRKRSCREKIMRKFLLGILLILLVILLLYKSPFSGMYYYNAAKKMYEAGQYEQSIPVFEKSLFSDPKNLLARFNYVLALSKSKPTLSVQKII